MVLIIIIISLNIIGLLIILIKSLFLKLIFILWAYNLNIILQHLDSRSYLDLVIHMVLFHLLNLNHHLLIFLIKLDQKHYLFHIILLYHHFLIIIFQYHIFNQEFHHIFL